MLTLILIIVAIFTIRIWLPILVWGGCLLMVAAIINAAVTGAGA